MLVVAALAAAAHAVLTRAQRQSLSCKSTCCRTAGSSSVGSWDQSTADGCAGRTAHGCAGPAGSMGSRRASTCRADQQAGRFTCCSTADSSSSGSWDRSTVEGCAGLAGSKGSRRASKHRTAVSRHVNKGRPMCCRTAGSSSSNNWNQSTVDGCAGPAGNQGSRQASICSRREGRQSDNMAHERSESALLLCAPGTVSQGLQTGSAHASQCTWLMALACCGVCAGKIP